MNAAAAIRVPSSKRHTLLPTEEQSLEKAVRDFAADLPTMSDTAEGDREEEHKFIEDANTSIAALLLQAKGSDDKLLARLRETAERWDEEAEGADRWLYMLDRKVNPATKTTSNISISAYTDREWQAGLTSFRKCSRVQI